MATRKFKILWAPLLVAVLMTVSACERETYDPADESDAPAEAVAVASDDYRLQVDGQEIASGEETTVNLAVLPGDDLKINLEFPWSFEFENADAVTVDDGPIDINAIDLTEERATIPVALTAQGAGQHTISGVGNFSVCNDKVCEVMRDEPVEFVVQAE